MWGYVMIFEECDDRTVEFTDKAHCEPCEK